MSKGEIIILGCGGSGGVPLACGHWGNCDPLNPKNRRTRSSIAIRTPKTCLVIDTGADFHNQTLINKIEKIDAVLYTHDHADHVNGIDDVRYLAIRQRVLGDQEYMLPIYTDKETMRSIQHRFDYLFRTSPDGLYFPLLDCHTIDEGSLQIGDINMDLFYQIHGRGKSFGIKIDDVGYSTDVSDFEKEKLLWLKGIKTWIVDCGQFGSDSQHLTVHPNLERVLEWNDIVQAEKLYLTHLTPRNDYDVINETTPDYVEAAYDGLKIKF